MPVDVLVLGATAVLAVVALAAAVVAVRASRRTAVAAAGTAPLEPVEASPASVPSTPAAHVVQPVDVVVPAPRPAHVVEGRIVVPPTAEQVAAAALTRPSVRFTALLHGVAHALRPESRDRIAALVRREYRDRRRTRLRAGRRAVRAAHPTPPGEQWLGELPAGRGAGER